MNWDVILLIAIIIIFVLLFIFRKNPFVKKYWKYALILLPAVVFLILRIISRSKSKDGDETKDKTLQTEITRIKEDLHEANTVAAIEVTAAKTKNKEKLEELKEVTKIKDSKSRRQRLADMMG